MILVLILFILISSPKTYELVRKLVGLLNKGWQDLIATTSGRPEPLGLFLHGIVFAYILQVLFKRAGYVLSGNETFMTEGKNVDTNTLSCYGGMPPNNALPDIPPVTANDIAHHP